MSISSLVDETDREEMDESELDKLLTKQETEGHSVTVVTVGGKERGCRTTRVDCLCYYLFWVVYLICRVNLKNLLLDKRN